MGNSCSTHNEVGEMNTLGGIIVAGACPVNFGSFQINTMDSTFPVGVEHGCLLLSDVSGNPIVPTESSTDADVITVSFALPGDAEIQPGLSMLTYDADESCTGIEYRGYGFFYNGFANGATCTASFGGTMITASVSLTCESTAVAAGFSVGPITEKRQVPMSATPISGLLMPVEASANGDPHLQGANGQKFDFMGQAGGIYNLFSADNVQVNMKLAPNGPNNHFMTEIGIVVADKKLVFGTKRFRQPERHLADLNAAIRQFGGVVSFGPNLQQYIVEVCGYRFEIASRITLHKVRDGDFSYLDIVVDAPDCPTGESKYGGILGPTFQCDVDDDAKHFEFDPSTEETFRVDSLGAANVKRQHILTCNAKDAIYHGARQISDGLTMKTGVKSSLQTALHYLSANNITCTAEEKKQKMAEYFQYLKTNSAPSAMDLVALFMN